MLDIANKLMGLQNPEDLDEVALAKFNQGLFPFTAGGRKIMEHAARKIPPEKIDDFCKNLSFIQKFRTEDEKAAFFQYYVLSTVKINSRLSEKLFQTFISQYPFSEKVAHVLASNLSLLQMINNHLHTLTDEQKMPILESLIKKSIQYSNITLLNALSQFAPGYEQIIATLPAEQINQFNNLMSKPNPDAYTARMLEYSSDFGKITHEGGLIAAAAIARSKLSDNKTKKETAYEFDPTILKEDELEDYLTVLKNAEKPIREKFVISGTHWLSGEIAIDKGKIKVLLIDSMGFDTENITDGKYIPLFENLRQVFGVETPIVAYVDDTKRQHSMKGCSVFSLDDATHLYNVDKYLPRIDESVTDIFSYLDATTKSKVTLPMDSDAPETGTLEMKVSGLPLSLMRTMQSTQFIDQKVTKEGVVQPSHLSQRSELEQETRVNSKGLTARQSFVDKLVNVDGKLQSHRLNHKLQRISEKTKDYLDKTSEAQIQADMQRYSVAGLPERLAKKQAKKEEQPQADRRKSLIVQAKIERGDDATPPQSSPELRREPEGPKPRMTR